MINTVCSSDIEKQKEYFGQQFLYQVRKTLQKWLLRTSQYAVSGAIKEAEVITERAINVLQWFKKVCSNKLLHMPILLGCTGNIVEIDESYFRHKPNINSLFHLHLIFIFVFHHHNINFVSTWIHGNDAATLLPII